MRVQTPLHRARGTIGAPRSRTFSESRVGEPCCHVDA